jgi:hypothetical protein
MHDFDLLPLIAELLERWKSNASLSEMFEEVQGERLLREKLFAAALLCEQLKTQSDGTAEKLCESMSALFNVYLTDHSSVDAFLNKALRNVPLRVAVKTVFAPEGGRSELWSMIQRDSHGANDKKSISEVWARSVTAASQQISQLLGILCRQKKS